jgi:hypothetical protein
MCILSHVFIMISFWMLCPSVSVCSIFIGDKFEVEDAVSWLFIIPLYYSLMFIQQMHNLKVIAVEII